VVTSLQDGFPKLIKKHLMGHEILVLLVVIISFLFGLPHITEVHTRHLLIHFKICFKRLGKEIYQSITPTMYVQLFLHVFFIICE
jgi:hypothetical protein